MGCGISTLEDHDEQLKQQRQNGHLIKLPFTVTNRNHKFSGAKEEEHVDDLQKSVDGLQDIVDKNKDEVIVNDGGVNNDDDNSIYLSPGSPSFRVYCLDSLDLGDQDLHEDDKEGSKSSKGSETRMRKREHRGRGFRGILPKISHE